MRFRIRPLDSVFFDLFTEAAQHLVIGSSLLAEMLSDSSDPEDVAARMRAAEHDADETAHSLIRRVNTTFVTPFDREDIYALASALDDVMDSMDEVVDLVLLYKVAELPADLSLQVEVLQRCADLTVAAMPRLRTMKSLDDFWIEINRLENVGDRNHRRSLAALFTGSIPTLEVLKLKDIVESLEEAVDGFERVANIVEQIALKES
ncbi:DUF47 domain-containing protein [Nocardioides sp.]|uniref:DUF47 domain-containing protein n=1 Tax=Nocardioides sp. TaxID=35761 RepID=UPI002B26FE78|nr:DUF47 family protein [Nocardioides sp.]